MDETSILKIIEEYILPSHTIVISTPNITHATNQHSVTVDLDLINELCASEELRKSMAKRLKSKVTVHSVPGMKDVVMMCLVTDGYKVSSRSFSCIDDMDVQTAWDFIDSSVVSSSDDTRNLLKRCTRGRSGDGFRRVRGGVRRVGIVGRPVHDTPEGRPVMVSEGISYTHSSAADAALEDCLILLGSSSDPLSVAVSIYEGTGSLNET